MTTEGKSARSLTQELAEATCTYCRSGLPLTERHGRPFHIYQNNDGRYCTSLAEQLLPIIERESRLYIAAALEMVAQKLERIGDDPTAHPGYNLACKDNARLVRDFITADVAQARAAHDREVREMALGAAERTVLSMWYNNYAKDIAQAIRALASATEERQAAKPGMGRIAGRWENNAGEVTMQQGQAVKLEEK